MDIKGVNGLYSYRPMSSLPKKNTVQGETISLNRESIEGDKVSISAGGSFKAKLDGLSKAYAAEASENTKVSSARISELKQLYKGDNVPVASLDVAGAIMGTVLGRGVI